MQKPKVVIIGAGFGGISCALALARARSFEIILIDKKTTFDFLPSLPDVFGRGISPAALSYGIKVIAERNRFEFINEEVSSVDLSKKEVCSGQKKIIYDYLVIASGSETNFYGNNNLKDSAYALDGVLDAAKILSVLCENRFDNFIIGGGGYTGIEVATNLRRFLLKKKQAGRIIIVEKSESILGPLPQWMKKYTAANLSALAIEVLTKSSVERIDAKTVKVSGSAAFDNAVVIWAAGVRTSGFIQALRVEKNSQGRIEVDEYLRLNANCFVVGDAAYVKHKENYLRMAVQFAITQGSLAAKNIMRCKRGEKLIRYKPVDLGFIMPMANNHSCGNVLGVNLKGKLPTLLHFFMCAYRLRGLRNKADFIKGLLSG